MYNIYKVEHPNDSVNDSSPVVEDKAIEETINESVETDGGSESLSKSAIKRKRKFEQLQNHWKEKKAMKKEKKKQKAKEKKETNQTEEGPSPEERIRLKELHRQQREQWLEEMKTSPRVLIDLDFQELMRPNELSSLTQQVMYSYGIIKRGAKPLRLVLTSVQDEIKDKLEKIKGFDTWLAEVFEKDFMKVIEEEESFSYSKNQIVYLSADAEETLTELKKDEIYIIGGIVDRNRYKFLTLNKAERLGIRCAKLPLELIRFHGSRVLTVNNVIDLLVRFHSEQNWEQAIQEGIPMRKKDNSQEEE